MSLEESRKVLSGMNEIKEKIEKAGGYAMQLLAVEYLEYHDKNWLDGDNKQNCERKIEALERIIKLLGYKIPTGW
jgi:hypothetical protein